ncbi:WD40 repeat domain-containing protein [Aetokthonos hydrillicola]|nr:PepSY-like domain-containing protein [Aetokthonos hydrillicola]MBO3463275.1 hypothetical protein [Aetokthonos hydrillicola CCALA 1050]MBW4589766.1 PepSY-like domain-containing protein [Aetokthonos hydrillicola CCALA 1050]
MSNNFLVRQILKAGGNFFVGASIAIATSFPIVLTSVPALSDTVTDITSEPLSTLQYLTRINKTPQKIAFTATGEWVIFSNNTSYVNWSNNFPQIIYNQLKSLVQQNIYINTIAFTPDGQSAILVYGVNNNFFMPFGKGFPSLFYYHLAQARQSQRAIKTIAFTPNGGWIILAGNNDIYQSENIPLDLLNALYDYRRQNLIINDIAFTSNGGWVILAGRDLALGANLPPAASNALIELARPGKAFESIAFTSDNRFVLFLTNELPYPGISCLASASILKSATTLPPSYRDCR